MNLLAITFVLALALSSMILMVAMRPVGASKQAQQRLVSIRRSVQAQRAETDGVELEQSGRRGYAARVSRLLERYEFAKQMKVLLVHADSSMSVGGVVLACAGAGLGGGVVSVLYFHTVLAAGIALLAGGAAPYLLLRRKSAQRLKAFNKALPGAIELMARALRAGHAIGTSIELIAEQAAEPLAGEFAQVYQQQRVGLQFREALLQMGERVPSRDLHFLVTAILVQKETGGDLTEILDRASHVIRERVRIEGEVRTHSAQGRLTGWILGLLPVIMLALVNIVSPGYSSVLFHDPTGQKLFYAGGALIVVGGLVIRKVVDIQV
jgi:tight adherence protein B